MSSDVQMSRIWQERVLRNEGAIMIVGSGDSGDSGAVEAPVTVEFNQAAAASSARELYNE